MELLGIFVEMVFWKSLELKSTSPTSWLLAAAVVGVTTIPSEVISTPLVIVIVFKVVRVSIVVPPVDIESGVSQYCSCPVDPVEYINSHPKNGAAVFDVMACP